MSIQDKFKAQKQKLNNLCEEHHLLCTLSLYTSPVTMTIKPMKDMYEQLSMLEQAESVGEKRISPDAYKRFYSDEGDYAVKTFGSFYMQVDLEQKFLRIFKKLDAFWKQFWHQETIKTHALRKGMEPLMDESDDDGSSSNTEEMIPEDSDIDAEDMSEDEGPADTTPDDELLGQAIALVRMENTCTTSLLMKKLKLGYSKALHLIDLLEQRGVIGPYKGGEPREVLPYDQPDDDVAAGA